MDLQDKRNRSIPTDFDIIADTSAHSGDWYGLVILGATFPDDATGVIVNGTGKNLHAVNDLFPDGYEIQGHFTRITLNGGVALAYKG